MRTYRNPLFQHRHYAEIARVLADLNAAPDTVKAFGDLFANDNGRFDRHRFIAAARGEPVNGKDARGPRREAQVKRPDPRGDMPLEMRPFKAAE